MNDPLPRLSGLPSTSRSYLDLDGSTPYILSIGGRKRKGDKTEREGRREITEKKGLRVSREVPGTAADVDCWDRFAARSNRKSEAREKEGSDDLEARFREPIKI